jgi:hypothetical protein
MRIGLTFILFFAFHVCLGNVVRTQSSDLVGQWKVEITFGDQSTRSLRLVAEESGIGSLLLEARSNWDEPAKPTKAKWTVDRGKSVTFSGPVDFPIGNVGRETGVLVFRGAFESGSKITGEYAFFPMDQDMSGPKSDPSKTGKFKATRIGKP